MTTPSHPPLSAPLLPASSARKPVPNAAAAAKRPPMRNIAFAVVAVGLLVATVFAFAVLRQTGGTSSINEVETDPETYTAEAVQRLASMSAAGATDTVTGVGAGGLPSGVEASTYAAFDAAIATAMQTLESSLAESALPEIPADYLAGDVIDVRLPPTQGYGLPALPALPVPGTLAGVSVDGVASPVGTNQGSSQLDDLVGQVEAGLSTLEGLLGELPVGGEGLPALPVGGGALPGLPGGGASSQAQGAQDAVDPDEAGASLADVHANALLGSTSSAYATTASDLTQLLAAYQSLALRVEETIALTRQVQDDTSAEIQATLDQRLADIDAEARSLNSQASRLVAEHLRLAEQAHAQAEADVRATLEQQVAGLGETRDEVVGNVTGRMQLVLTQAEARKAEVQALVDAAVAELGKPGASQEALYGLEAVQAAAAVATLKIDREAKAELVALAQSRSRIEAHVTAIEGNLAEKAEEALVDVDGTVEDAIAGSSDVKAYLIAFAQAQAQKAEAREILVAGEALETLEVAADAHVAKLLRTSLKSTAAADGIFEATTALVQEVETMAASEVGKDVDYIAKVSQDYSRVPTEERKSRATHWSAAAVDLEGRLDETLAAGLGVERLAQRTVDAAAQAQADIEAMA